MPDEILPPVPHAEGGPAASSVSPGDTRRELIHEVRNLSTSMTLLRQVVIQIKETRPSVAEVGYKRYRSVFWVVLFIVAMIWAADTHTEACGPGAASEAAIRVLINDGTYEQIKGTAAGTHAPGWCDVTFPLHSHDAGGWPSQDNLIGLGLYGVMLGVGTLGFIRHRRRANEAEIHVPRHESE